MARVAAGSGPSWCAQGSTRSLFQVAWITSSQAGGRSGPEVCSRSGRPNQAIPLLEELVDHLHRPSLGFVVATPVGGIRTAARSPP
ncbi:hypothetical protein KBY99_05510 [Cyanobium sp. Maggiore-St4-Cus]|uniref:hypothetical protein n=1 Tax=Cyanobium sp. Maggiore-St4-Cus TaxID=2823717 RepID=UPI0020CE6318|nr:hypothetical protein [Cyanobium sp. Maggiore-St4-Cus]MCP9788438.1 hypothetical protein [Cyanobium sp. Maggiore-St4-Cus]